MPGSLYPLETVLPGIDVGDLHRYPLVLPGDVLGADLAEAETSMKCGRDRVRRMDIYFTGQDCNIIAPGKIEQVAIQRATHALPGELSVDDDPIDIDEPRVTGSEPGEVGIVVCSVVAHRQQEARNPPVNKRNPVAAGQTVQVFEPRHIHRAGMDFLLRVELDNRCEVGWMGAAQFDQCTLTLLTVTRPSSPEASNNRLAGSGMTCGVL